MLRKLNDPFYMLRFDLVNNVGHLSWLLAWTEGVLLVPNDQGTFEAPLHKGNKGPSKVLREAILRVCEYFGVQLKSPQLVSPSHHRVDKSTSRFL